MTLRFAKSSNWLLVLPSANDALGRLYQHLSRTLHLGWAFQEAEWRLNLLTAGVSASAFALPAAVAFAT